MAEASQNQTRLIPKPGAEDFRDLRRKNGYYVDKTQYLKPLFCSGSDWFLLLRPRRFGKTLTMSTLRYFLEMDYQHPCDTSSQQELFRGLKVMDDHEFCEEHMGQYPVVSLSLKGVKASGFDVAYDRLARTISNLAKGFRWLDGPELAEDDRDFLNILINYRYLRQPANRGYAEGSLAFLCRLLRERFGDSHKPVLLIDEYDVPLQKAAISGYYGPMSDLIGEMLGDALKTNSDTSKVILTGCLRATKEGIFTGLNNLSIDTVLTDSESLGTAIGFTPVEVRAMMDYYGLGDLYERAREWYDGYSIGGQDLFCPWDVTSYVSELSDVRDPAAFQPKPYWNNTSNTPVITEHMPNLTSEDADRIEALLAGGSIRTEVDEGMSYGTLHLNNLSSEQFWNILLYTGYLTLDRRCDDGINELRIPNEEIRRCFKKNISDYYKSKGPNGYGALVRKLIDELLSGDSVNATESLRTLLRGFVSLRDNATRAPHENFYHGFLNGLLAAVRDYIGDFQSEAESGRGYADITFSSYDGASSVVIEVKYASDAAARLQELASKAIAQIEEKGYAAALCSEGSDRVIECGIAFRGRECAVRCRELLPDVQS
ncbi:MAG: AAA family ATPase [Succinivibrionaceae bacterium]|jgi:hypothetical protein|nr:AAA family ATPase [Succinivibrionaceae bacterium]MCI6199140.1 ATP-binding protein [Pseudomonadota bacterium]MDY3144558.1 AAA family ATPase [Succinivibrionaceae bacterium]MDY6274888.1 AAA family ATPase [Succinivibrionaceae bacterium]MDY6335922.1 AAA family ATPase [Succinivibrionaceae bacterium]